MATAVKVRATVQAGHRVEFTAPELAEGSEVEIIALVHEPGAAAPVSMLELRKTFPPRHLTDEQWARRDREFQEERDQWDR
jgi:hypothetical protein